MVKGTTKTGFAFELPDNAVDNMELVDALAEIESGESPLAISRVCSALLGKQTKKALYDHIRQEGRVPTKALEVEIMDIFAAFGNAGKN